MNPLLEKALCTFELVRRRGGRGHGGLPAAAVRLQIDAVWRAHHRSALLQQVIDRVLAPASLAA